MSILSTEEQTLPTTETFHLKLNQHIEDGDVEGVRQWLNERPCITQVKRRPFSVRDPVCLATERGHTEIFDLLVDHGFSYRSLDEGGPGYRRPALEPIHLAAQKGHLDLVQKLVEVYKADVNSVANQTTVLHLAVTDRRVNVVNYLLRHGADPMRSPSVCRHVKRRSSLLIAVRLGYWELVTTFLNSLEIQDDFPLVSILDQILQSYRRDIAYMLYEKVPGTLFTDILNRDFLAMTPEVLHFLLEVYDSSVYDEQTSMFDEYADLAATSGHLSFLKLLLEAGCPVNKVTKSSLLNDVKLYFGPHSDEAHDCMKTYLSSPYSLKDLSIFRIRRHLGKMSPSIADRLPLPIRLKELIQLDHLKHHYMPPVKAS